MSLDASPYIPEDHAPDPILGRGDPTPPGKVGIWLFIASEIMFFVSILGSYIVLRADNHALFARMAADLSKGWGGLDTLVLICSSLTMALAVDAARQRDRRKLARNLSLTLLCACVFMAVLAKEYHDEWIHETIVAREGSAPQAAVFVYDGRVVAEDAASIVLRGFSARADALDRAGRVDIHLVSPADVKAAQGRAPSEAGEARGDADAADQNARGPGGLRASEEGTVTISKSLVAGRINYFAWKNMFFGCYFTLTAVHGLHVLAGVFVLLVLLAHALRGKTLPAATEYVGLYWHFVNMVWIFLFPLLYLI